MLDRLGPRRRLPTVMIQDPQEPVPSGGIDPPNPHPNLAATASPAPSEVGPSTGQAPPEGPSGATTPQPTAAAPADPRLPEPPPPRQVARDKDGASLPAGRRPGELAEAITPIGAFYVVTKNAAGDPPLRPQEWRLRVDGEVQRPVELDYATLLKLIYFEVTKTL